MPLQENVPSSSYMVRDRRMVPSYPDAYCHALTATASPKLPPTTVDLCSVGLPLASWSQSHLIRRPSLATALR
ncbi:hypothetical protein N7467_006140 [Penicillium canescens]|nr:hypothetical protein N7467_006140 [Penicillium canescens]